MITVVITSCNRLDFLKVTIDSFLRFNTYPISEYIIVDDSGNADAHNEIRRLYPNWTLILEPKHRGQIQCIDDAYAHVKTPYIFHCEDDWEFFKAGFMEPSLKILEHDKKVMIVWILHPPNHPIEQEIFKIDNIEYRLVGVDISGSWHGFTWNPSLRRLADYKLVEPYSGFIQAGDFNALTECHIGIELYEKYGFRVASINDEYCKHIGGGRIAVPC
jgi:GT2 family glycosyltransferase